MLYVLALALALVDGASALQSPCSMSRVSLSRVARNAVAARAPMPFMCDAAEPAAEATAEPAAEAEAPARRAHLHFHPRSRGARDLEAERAVVW